MTARTWASGRKVRNGSCRLLGGVISAESLPATFLDTSHVAEAASQA